MGKMKSIMQFVREGHSDFNIAHDEAFKRKGSYASNEPVREAVKEIAKAARKQQEGAKKSDTK